jgi:uncharacterized membrane protein YfcA
LLTIYDYALLFLLGSLGAFIAGFLGVGGGIIYIPILDFFLSKIGLKDDQLVKAVLANSLFTIIFSGSVSSYKQYRMGNFFPREIIATAIPGMCSALALTWFISLGNWYSRTMFLYVFASMLFLIIVRMLMHQKRTIEEKSTEEKLTAYAATGFFAGMVTAFSGLGGGVVMTPVFTDVLKQPIRKATSVSNGVIPFFAITIGILNLSNQQAPIITHWQVGYIFIPLVLPMILSTFIFAPWGVKISQTTKPEIIRVVFAFFASMVFLKIIYELFF